jgi:predicted Zn-dependent protease with MMP-like domain
MSSNYPQDSSYPSQSYSSYQSQQYNSISAPPATFVPRTDLEKWAVILVIDVPPDQALSSHLGVYYRDVVVTLMAGLKYEERRSAYVTEEVARITTLRDSAVDNGVFSDSLGLE